MYEHIFGVVPPMTTPFRDDDSIDEYSRHLDFLWGYRSRLDNAFYLDDDFASVTLGCQYSRQIFKF